MKKKTVSTTYSVRVFLALGTQHAIHIAPMFSSVACPAVQYFSTLSYKRHDLKKIRKENLLNTKCVFSFSLQILPETFFILRRTATREIGLEISANKTKYMVMSRDQNAGRNHSVWIDNSTFDRVEEFKYLGTNKSKFYCGRT